jgi:cytochrome c biogenesis protein CcmG/thiol:disulfide interchange protein DsbE
MIGRYRLWALSLVVIAACSGDGANIDTIGPLEPVTPAEVRAILSASTQPIVVNVWASWCGPCRSEAPLLRAAAAEFSDEVGFLGIDVRDSQEGARAFIAEFGLDGFPHLFDPDGAVPADLGGRGVPITFFFEAGGDLSSIHPGVIDEATLALRIDDLLADS